MARNTERNEAGRYDVSRMDRMCRCGHRLSVHLAARPRPCGNADDGMPGASGESCGCERFTAETATDVNRRMRALAERGR